MGNPNQPPFYVIVTKTKPRTSTQGSDLVGELPAELRVAIRNLAATQPDMPAETMRDRLLDGPRQAEIKKAGMSLLLNLIKTIKEQLRRGEP
ncbi:hypothetical protein [Nonomuraea sp. NPDC003214]